jgi:hypothetical protein
LLAENIIEDVHERHNEVIELPMLNNGRVFGTLSLRIEDEQFKRRVPVQQSDKLKRYLQEQGIERSFRLIFAEVLHKRMPTNEVFQYTATRLRQIGKDLDELRHNSQH